MIQYDEKNKLFHLSSSQISYCIESEGNLKNLYFGKRIKTEDIRQLKGKKFHSSFDQDTTDEREEFTCFNGHNFIIPNLKMRAGDIRALDMRVGDYRIEDSDECETLILQLEDQNGIADVELHYILYREYPIIERKTIVKALQKLELTSAYTATMNISNNQPVNLKYISGKWAGEWQIKEEPVVTGIKTLSTKRGLPGPHFNPAIALAESDATETTGNIWFALLGYSGNWAFHIEHTIFNHTRIVGGINNSDFLWPMEKGDSFETPPMYIGYTDSGLGEMSRCLHRFEKQKILPRHKTRKILYNSWEATAFQVEVDKQKKLAKKAADIGCELFVVDDGWFGERNDDNAGLGDWFVNQKKFPNGLQELIGYVKDLGMDFGIWIEPEAINPDSELYRRHPEWIYRQNGIEPVTARNQYVLNITLPEVQAYLKDCMKKLLSENDISFLKWDMNRCISDIGSNNCAVPEALWHKHVLALYDLWNYLRINFPYLEIETCAGGGGRVELGILKYADQCWPSDNTDPYDRLQIQEGFTMFYSPAIMMSWVTDTGNERRRGALSLKYRFYSAMCGCLSIGADISQYNEEQLLECKNYITQYKKWRHIIQEGDVYRLISPDRTDNCAVEYLSEDKQEGIVFAFFHGGHFGDGMPKVRLQGLDNEAAYSVSGYDDLMSGAFLTNVGLDTALLDDYDCKVYYIKKI